MIHIFLFGTLWRNLWIWNSKSCQFMSPIWCDLAQLSFTDHLSSVWPSVCLSACHQRVCKLFTISSSSLQLQGHFQWNLAQSTLIIEKPGSIFSTWRAAPLGLDCLIRGNELQSEGTSCPNRGNELQFERTDCLIRGNELQSERTGCPIRGNELLFLGNKLLIRENGLHN